MRLSVPGTATSVTVFPEKRTSAMASRWEASGGASTSTVDADDRTYEIVTREAFYD